MGLGRIGDTVLSGNHVPVAACCELTLADPLGPKIRWAQQNSIQK